jgi:hypothetical protein
MISRPRHFSAVATLATVAMLSAVVVLATQTAPAGAAATCFGERVTINAVPGQVTRGTSGRDVISGTSGPDQIYGRGGADLICAGGGNDQVYGGAGADRINLGKGNDYAEGGKGADTINGQGGRDRIQGNGGADAISGGPKADTIWGGKSADRVTGNAGKDVLYGNGGRDIIDGGKGSDACIGGAGADAQSRCERASATPGQNSAWTMRCILYLHGAGTSPGQLSDQQWESDLLYLRPASPNNEPPHFWLYDGPHNFARDVGDTNKPYNDIVDYLTAYLNRNECGPVMMHGASNGGGLAARIYCSGEDFGGRLWMAFIDDPVPDAGVIGCSPSPAVQRSLFVHSTELAEQAETFVNNRCSRTAAQYAWYCQDDIGFDVDEYEAHIGQESFLARNLHSDANRNDLSFWSQVHNWWADIDMGAYRAYVG